MFWQFRFQTCTPGPGDLCTGGINDLSLQRFILALSFASQVRSHLRGLSIEVWNSEDPLLHVIGDEFTTKLLG